MFDSKERQKRQLLGSKTEAMRGILKAAETEQRELTAEECKRFDALEVEAGELQKDIGIVADGKGTDREQRVSGLEKELSRIVNPHLPSNFNVTAATGEQWRDGEGNLVRVYDKGESVRSESQSPEYDGLTFGSFMRAAVLGPRNDVERRALAEGTDSAGYTVSPALLPDFIDKLRAKSTVFRAGARTVTLDTGKATTIVRLASDVTAAWRSENAAISPADVTFEAVTFTPRSLAGATLVSRELLEDSANVQQMLENSFAQAFAAEIDRVALIGSGVAPEPKGIKNITNVQTYAMGTNGAQLTDYAPIVQAYKLIDDANAPEPSACIMHTRNMASLSLAKDTTNQPLQRPFRIANLPFLQTSKLPTNEAQGTSGTVCNSMFVGDFTQLMIAFRTQLRVEILKERYAENLQYGFLGYLRADLNVTHPEAFVRVLGILP